MSKELSIITYSCNSKSEWDIFCNNESQAWFWHTSDRMNHVMAAADGCAVNQSFFILLNSVVVAIVPFVITQDDNHKRVASYLGWGTPSPVISKKISESNAKRVKKAAFAEMDNISREYKLDKIILSTFYQPLNSNNKYCYYVERTFII